MKSSNKPVRVAVVLPSRGLIFSQTADEILQNLEGIPHKFFFAHQLPIPDCFEKPVEAILNDSGITHVWFVEDDMILPPDTLKKMLEKDKAVVVADYPVTKDGKGAMLKIKNEVIFSGTGCTLVNLAVFVELKPPYFRCDTVWNVKNYGDFIKMTGVPRGDQESYGLHDVNFFMSLWRKGIPVHDVGITVGQRKLINLGKAGTNDGAHNIEEWTKVKKDYTLKKIKNWPVEKHGSMTTVITPDGELMVSPSHAKTLIKKGLATPTPKRAIVVDDTEIPI